MRYPITILSLYLCILLLATACSATPHDSPTDDPVPAQTNSSADPLRQILQQAQQQQQQLERKDKRYPKGIPSVSTFAFFTAIPLHTQQEQYQQHLFASIAKQMQQDKIAKNWHRKIQERFSLVAVPIDQDLPINIDVFKSMPAPGPTIVKQSTDVMFMRYAGPVMTQNKHLQFLCQGLLDVSQVLNKLKQPFVVAHLNTLQLLDYNDVQQLCKLPDTAWVKPAVELTDLGKVRFVSRGLAQFGQPDLESNVMDKKEAPQWLRAFQVDMLGLLSTDIMRVNQVWQGRKLQACQRANHHYELDCVLIDYSQVNR